MLEYTESKIERCANSVYFKDVMHTDSQAGKPKNKDIINPIEIAHRIQPNYIDKTLDNSKPPIDPKGLSEAARDAVIEYLKYHEGLMNIEIADLMKIHPATVWRKLERIAERRTIELHSKGYSIWAVVEKIEAACALVQRKARDAKDWRLFWDAEIRKWTELQKLGVVYEKPLEIDIRAVFTEKQARAIIDILAEEEKLALTENSNGGIEDG